MNWTAIGVLFGIFSWIVTIGIMVWNNAKNETRKNTKMENELVEVKKEIGICLKMIGEQNRTIKAYFKKLDIFARKSDILWAVFEERTGKMPIDSHLIEKQENENGDQ